jgi:hypothetical protein
LTLQEANGDTSGAESPSIQAWLAARLKGRAKTRHLAQRTGKLQTAPQSSIGFGKGTPSALPFEMECIGGISPEGMHVKPGRPAMRNGEIYFVTSATAERAPFFRYERWCTLFIEALYHYRKRFVQV